MGYPRSRLAIRSADDRSVGFLLAGASAIAGRWMVDAVRQQPPAPGSRDVAAAWVVAVHSHNERRGREFADTHAIVHASTDLEALLQRPEVQAVYVGNHPRHHASTVRTALLAHKHVLCEPPLSLDRDEAIALGQMASHRGLVLALNYTWRSSALAHQVHTRLQDDAIGEVLGGRIQNTTFLPATQQTWRLQPGGGGVLLDRTLHDIDLLQFLLHRAVRAAYAHATHSIGANAVEEEILGYLTFSGGLVCQVFDSFVQPHAPLLLELWGTEGALRSLEDGAAGRSGMLELRRGSQAEALAVDAVNPYRAAIGRFLAATRGDAPPLATVEDEVRNLAVIEAMRTSLVSGQMAPVAIAPRY